MVIGNADALHSVTVVADKEAEVQRQGEANNLKNMLQWAEILESYGCPEERLAAEIKRMAQADVDPNNNGLFVAMKSVRKFRVLETTLAMPTVSTETEDQYATLDNVFDTNDHLDLVLQGPGMLFVSCRDHDNCDNLSTVKKGGQT